MSWEMKLIEKIKEVEKLPPYVYRDVEDQEAWVLQLYTGEPIFLNEGVAEFRSLDGYHAEEIRDILDDSVENYLDRVREISL